MPVEIEVQSKSKVEQIKQREANYKAKEEEKEIKELLLSLHKKIDALDKKVGGE